MEIQNIKTKKLSEYRGHFKNNLKHGKGIFKSFNDDQFWEY